LVKGKLSGSRDERLVFAERQPLRIEPEIEAHHAAQVMSR